MTIDKPKLELSDAYRKSRSGVSILSGIAVGWAATQFEFSSVKLPVLGDIVLSQYAVPIFLAVTIIYSMMRCTTEFVMQPINVRQWPKAQFDYEITLIASCVGVLLLAASGVSRSVNTVIVVTGVGILLFVAYWVVFFIITFALTPVILSLRLRKKPHTSAVGGVLTSMAYATLFASLGIFGTITIGGSNLLLKGYNYFGFSDTPNPVSITVFLFTALLFAVGCVFHNYLMKKVFAFEPPYAVKTKKLEDGTTLVTFQKNDKATHQEHNT